MSIELRKWALLAAVCGSLAACGGGGGGGDDGGESPTETVVDPVPTSFSISGTIQIPSGTLVDTDTADPDSGASPNNSFTTAQTILNPSVVGGYVSAVGGRYGLTSEFVFPVDTTDIFRVTLLQGQSVRLEVFDADTRFQQTATNEEQAVNPDGRSPRVTLRLFSVDDTATAVRTSSLDATGKTSADATIIAPEGGDFFVRIDESAGPTNYLLTIGQFSSQAYLPSLADEFVPGEALVTWDTGTAAVQSNRSVANRFTAVSGHPATGQLVRFNVARGPATSRALTSSNGEDSQLEQKRLTLAAIDDLRAQPGVRSAEPNYIRRAFLTPSDPLFSLQWHYPLINLPQAWDLDTNRGNGVVIAVLDTGVLPNHPDLAGQFVDGFDFVSSIGASVDGNGIDSDPTDPGDSPVGKSSYHGTHVAGTVAALANNGAGGVGVAFGARVMPLRVLGENGQGTDADIAEAIRYAAGLSNASQRLPARKADIINLSLGSGSQSTVLRQAIEAARAAGVILVAAAGNDGSSQLNFPAAYEGVVSVSGVGADKKIAPYSNFGATIDVAAPGGNFRLDIDRNGQPDGIVSTWGDDEAGKPARHTFSMMEGTSMAAPHVAGVVALMKAIKPELTPAQFDQLLLQGSLTQAVGDRNFFGNGLIDASKAVRKAQNAELQPIVVATPSALSFDGLENSMDVVLVNGGEGALSIQATTAATDSGANWLSVQPIDVAADGLGTYRVSVDRSGLNASLTHAGSITVDSNLNDLSIPVLLQPVDAKRLANAGRHYLLLIDPALPEDAPAVEQIGLDASAGAYNFVISDVPPGTYLLIAGSDIDNDGLICDAGEACAVYPVRNKPLDVVVGKDDLTGYVFNTGFLSDVGIQSFRSTPTRTYSRLPINRD